jgi:hypothetical protein
MLEQWLRTRAARARFHAGGRVLVLDSSRASGPSTVQVVLGDLSSLALEKRPNNDTAVVLSQGDVLSQGQPATSRTLLVFRDEADAKAVLDAARQALTGKSQENHPFERTVRVVLQLLLSLLVVLALAVIWRGYDTARASQKAADLNQSRLSGQLQGAAASPGSQLTPEQVAALRQQVMAGQGQPMPGAPSAPTPEASQGAAPQQTAPAPGSPGDAVARGLEGN